MVKLLIDYANNNNIILNINDRENENGHYPIFGAILRNNIEIVKILIDYVNKNNILLVINKNDIKDSSKIDIEILQILMKYSMKYNLDFRIEDSRLKENIESNTDDLLNYIEKENIQKVKLLLQKKNININLTLKYK